MKKVTLGGERLGSGNKQRVYMDGYHSSNHDLSFVFRSTMDAGTLVPFLKIPMVIGDNFDINLSALIKTLPTGGPLYGSFKWQADLFFCPNRLYIGGLHNNATGIGRKMGSVLLPTITFPVKKQQFSENDINPNHKQVAPDSLVAYLGIRGFGENISSEDQTRSFNGLPFLAVPDIFKNFYSNKQEKNAYVIGSKTYTLPQLVATENLYIDQAMQIKAPKEVAIELGKNESITYYFQPNNQMKARINENTIFRLYFLKNSSSTTPETASAKIGQPADVYINSVNQGTVSITKNLYDIDGLYTITIRSKEGISGFKATLSAPTGSENGTVNIIAPTETIAPSKYGIINFPLENIDNARDIILSKYKIGQKVDISESGDINFMPYVNVTQKSDNTENWENISAQPKSGLLLRTYLSDVYNNWIQTEWIDEINAASAIRIGDSGSFTMDALVLAKRTWQYQNRVAVSGGTYQDWEEATYGREAQSFCESPIYMGGASGIIGFEEVVSTAASGEEALGTLAGQGGLHGFKGGKINVKAQEHGYLIGIVSIVPHVDYYQGNDWDMTELKSMESYHMPEFDGIGFQDLITERMAAWDTKINSTGELVKKSAGKQPAWSQYMTNHNKVYGDFCRETTNENQGSGAANYMVITRKYHHVSENNQLKIDDLTTYVFPQDYNYLFTTKDLRDNPFWVQIGCDIFARRIMSAAIMPTL